MQLTISKSMTETLGELFKNHIGKDNGILESDIMDELYQQKLSYYESRFYWYRKVLPAMHYLRKNTKCFVISSWVKHQERKGDEPLFERTFFVIKTMEEFETYKKRCRRQIEGLKDSIIRARTAVKEEWHKQL